MADAVDAALARLTGPGERALRFARPLSVGDRRLATATFAGPDGGIAGWWVGDAATGEPVDDAPALTAAACLDYLARAFAHRHDWLAQLAGHANARASGLAHVDAVTARVAERDPALVGAVRRYERSLAPLRDVAEAGRRLGPFADGFVEWIRTADPIDAGPVAALVEALAAYDAAADRAVGRLAAAEQAAHALDAALEAAGHPARTQLPDPAVLATWADGDGAATASWSAAISAHVATLLAARRR